jgi:hypothetical protein
MWGAANQKFCCKHKTVSFLKLLIHLRVWEDGKSTALEMELYG